MTLVPSTMVSISKCCMAIHDLGAIWPANPCNVSAGICNIIVMATGCVVVKPMRLEYGFNACIDWRILSSFGTRPIATASPSGKESAMQSPWYYSAYGKSLGPFSEEEILAIFHHPGGPGSKALVFNKEATGEAWIYAEEIPGLLPDFPQPISASGPETPVPLPSPSIIWSSLV